MSESGYSGTPLPQKLGITPASAVITDLSEDVLREIALPRGLVDNKVCAIDETWSGVRFVWRKERRTPARPVH